MGSSSTIFVAGVAVACILLAVGSIGGYLFGFRRSQRALGQDRRRLLDFVHDLGNWTSEYSGSVTRYQTELGTLSAQVQRNVSVKDGKIVDLLQQIMISNQGLQKRLEAAEKQLDRQTKQMEDYLSEARSDALTGLANRRAFDQQFETMFQAYGSGTGRAFVVALVDIDHFKQINDQYGHPAGDEVLREVARLLGSQLSGGYLTARFGGEEFVALLPTPLRLAADRMDRLRKQIETQTVESEQHRIKVTISIGLAEVREQLTGAQVIRRADEALYAAKGRGRNRVYFHDGSQPMLLGAPEIAGD